MSVETRRNFATSCYAIGARIEAPSVRDFRISRFRLADLKGVLELESTAFRKDAYSAAMFLELYHKCPDFFLIAKSHGTVVGYVVAYGPGRNAEIISIAVDPKHRKHGIGKALMMRALAKLRVSGVPCVKLTVRPANRAAIRLYSILGFHRVRRITQYYSDAGDALQMQKVFAPQVKRAPMGRPRSPSDGGA
jgi:ribosomal-protein-alanine N-acetyltransferase